MFQMEQMLQEYHHLQMEELKMRHLDDVDRLIRQKQQLQAIVDTTTESSSTDIVSQSTVQYLSAMCSRAYTYLHVYCKRPPIHLLLHKYF